MARCQWVDKCGMRLTVFFGAITATVGMAPLALSGPQGSYLVNILGPSVVVGVGMALIFLPLSLTAGTSVPADRQGIASGSINVSRVTGGALGLSVIAAAQTDRHLDPGIDPLIAHAGAHRLGFLMSGALLLLSVFTALMLPPNPGDQVRRRSGTSGSVRRSQSGCMEAGAEHDRAGVQMAPGLARPPQHSWQQG